jgi:surface antigen
VPLTLLILAFILTASPGATTPALASQNPGQELARLNQQLHDDQAKLDALNNSVEVAEAEADRLSRQLAADREREADLQLHIFALARTEYERPALTLSTVLEAPSLDRLLAVIAQSHLVAQKQGRLSAEATQLRRQDQQAREQQADNLAKIKQARDEAARVAASTLALRDRTNDSVTQARADAVAAQARATQAAHPRPAPAPAPAPAPPRSSSPPPGAIVEAPGPNHFAYGYCTWYVANRRNVPWFGNAIEWWPNARPYGYAEGQTPVVGAIMVTRESGWGHVAYVESIHGDGSWTVSEMNFVGWNIISSRTLRPGQAPVVGFIYGRA